MEYVRSHEGELSNDGMGGDPPAAGGASWTDGLFETTMRRAQAPTPAGGPNMLQTMNLERQAEIGAQQADLAAQALYLARQKKLKWALGLGAIAVVGIAAYFILKKKAATKAPSTSKSLPALPASTTHASNPMRPYGKRGPSRRSPSALGKDKVDKKKGKKQARRAARLEALLHANKRHGKTKGERKRRDVADLEDHKRGRRLRRELAEKQEAEKPTEAEK